MDAKRDLQISKALKVGSLPRGHHGLLKRVKDSPPLQAKYFGSGYPATWD